MSDKENDASAGRGPVPASRRLPLKEETVPKPPDPAAPLDELPQFETEHTFPLSRKIKYHGKQGLETFSDVTLRSPIGSDLFDVGGMPSTSTWSPGGMRVEMNTKLTRDWIIKLSGRDGGFVGQMSGRDIRACYDWIVGELNPAGN